MLFFVYTTVIVIIILLFIAAVVVVVYTVGSVHNINLFYEALICLHLIIQHRASKSSVFAPQHFSEIKLQGQTLLLLR